MSESSEFDEVDWINGGSPLATLLAQRHQFMLGPPGTGKAALIREMYPPTRKQRLRYKVAQAITNTATVIGMTGERIERRLDLLAARINPGPW